MTEYSDRARDEIEEAGKVSRNSVLEHKAVLQNNTHCSITDRLMDVLGAVQQSVS